MGTMVQVKDLGSSLRSVLASGAARLGMTQAANATTTQPPAATPSTGRAAEQAPIQRSAEVNTTFQPATPPEVPGDATGVDRNKPRNPVARFAADQAADPTLPQGTTEGAGPPSSTAIGVDARGIPGIAGTGRESAYQAQRIAQEVIPQVSATGDDGQAGAQASGGFSTLARKVASSLYSFVRDAVTRATGDSAPGEPVLIREGYSGRVDLEA
jgi:hypothetical protein